MVDILRKRLSPLSSFLIAVVAIVIIGAILVVIPPINDPTEGTFTVYVVNDTARPIRISFCHNSRCSERDGPTTLRRGEQYPQNISNDVDEELLVWKDEGSDPGVCRVLQGSSLHANQKVPVTVLAMCDLRATARERAGLGGQIGGNLVDAADFAK